MSKLDDIVRRACNGQLTETQFEFLSHSIGMTPEEVANYSYRKEKNKTYKVLATCIFITAIVFVVCQLVVSVWGP